jgi:hypothetical protein
MIRQNIDRDCLKWTTLLNSSVGTAEAINLIDQQTAVAIRENDREEENASFDPGSKVSRHGVFFHDMVGTARRAPLPTLQFTRCL